MTDAGTIDRQDNQSPDPLLVTDAELIRKLQVPERTGYAALAALDGNPLSGFPKKQKIWGGRRWWPAVVAYFERTNGLNMAAPQPQRDGHVRQA